MLESLNARFSAMEQKIDKLEKSNDKLEKSNKRLETENKNLKADIDRLERSYAKLEAQNEKQEEEIRDLRRDLVEEKALRDGVSEALIEVRLCHPALWMIQRLRTSLVYQVTRLITPLHLRVLLDAARQQILQDMNIESWEALRGQRNAHDLAIFLFNRLSQRAGATTASGSNFLPSLHTFRFLCLYNNVRREGNLAAHSASKPQVREAVQKKDIGSAERACLEEMFRYAYKDSEI